MTRRLCSVGASVSWVIALGALGPTVGAVEAPPTGTWFDGLAAGVCFDDVLDTDGEFDFSVPAVVVPCTGPHGNEVVARIGLGRQPAVDESYPTEDLAPVVADQCAQSYEAFLGRPVEETALGSWEIWPDASDWAAGARDVLCILFSERPLHGSAASGDLKAPGETLAVYREFEGGTDLWLVDAGSGAPLRKVTDDGSGDLLGAPDWSPDGELLAYTRLVAEDDADVFVAPSAGGAASRLVSGPAMDDGATFSPDGTRLAYVSREGATEYDILLRTLEDGSVTRLTSNDVKDASPQWSPDGSRIAFRRVSEGVSDIWVMDSDGKGAQRLTDGAGDDFDPRWSPDGGVLLFTSDRLGSYDIWVMNADGSEQRPLIAHPADDEYPTWSTDGRFVAFHSDRHGGVTLWLARADGSQASLLSPLSPIGYPMFAPAVSE